MSSTNRGLTFPAWNNGYWPEHATNIPDVATLGDRIARGRTKARLSQSELAKAVGVTRSWIGAVETDRISRPRPASLRLLADQLGLDYNELLAITDQLGEVAKPAAKDVDALRGEALAAMTEAIREQTSVFREMLSLMREDRQRMIAPEALGIFLEQLRTEGMLTIPEKPANTDAPAPRGAARPTTPIRDALPR
jgi:transcriptional regulator with XRE-family HTH domain